MYSTHCPRACCCPGTISTRATVALDGPFFAAQGLAGSHNVTPCPCTFGPTHGKVSPLLLAPGSYPTPRWFPCVCVCGQSPSCARLSATPWTIAHQAPLSMEFPGREYCELVAMPSSRGSFQPRNETCVSYVSCIGRWILYYQHYLGSPLAPLTLLTRLMPSTNPA